MVEEIRIQDDPTLRKSEIDWRRFTSANIFEFAQRAHDFYTDRGLPFRVFVERGNQVLIQFHFAGDIVDGRSAFNPVSGLSLRYRILLRADLLAVLENVELSGFGFDWRQQQ